MLTRPTGPSFNDLTPVIGYVRVSTWREDKISIEIQKAAITEATSRRRRYVAQWIEDPDESGRHFKRKIMQGIELVEAGAAPEIWVWKFSRFGRSRHGVAVNLARVERVGGELLSATEDVDANTATGRFARGMLFEVAAFESDRAGEQWRETHEHRRSAGLPATGRPRFGYIWHPRRIPDGRGGWTLQEEWYEVEPPRAEILLDVYTNYIKGNYGFGRLARQLNEWGVPNVRNAPWTSTGLTRYLDSGFAAGLLHVHRRDVRCGNVATCQKRQQHFIYLPAEHEAILQDDEWKAYCERRQERWATPRRAMSPVYPLAGLTRCGHCGGPATVQNGGPRGAEAGYSYRCDSRARGKVSHSSVFRVRSEVEKVVFDWLADVRLEIDAIAAGREVRPRKQPLLDTEKQRRQLEADLARITAGLDRATEGHALGDIPRDAYLRTRDRLLKRRADAEHALAELGPAPEALPNPVALREVVAGLLGEWDVIAVEAKRKMLARVIRRVEVTKESIVVVPVWESDQT